MHADVIRDYARHLYKKHNLNTDVPDERYGFKLPLHVLTAQAYCRERPWSDVVLLLSHLPPQMAKDALISIDGGLETSPLHWAAGRASSSVINLMLALAPDMTRLKDSNGWLPLHYAVHYYNFDSVQILADACPEDLVETNNDGDTPLHYAISKRFFSVIARLIKLASNSTKIKNSRGCLPLHIAVRRKNIDIVKSLIHVYPGAIIEMDNEGRNPLHWAAALAPRSMIDAILRLAPDLALDAARMKDVDGCLPLHIAALKNSTDTIKMLVHAYPAGILETDNKGSNSLCRAAAMNVEAVRMLFCAYQRALVETDNDGKTPIDLMKLENIFKLPLVELSHQALNKIGS